MFEACICVDAGDYESYAVSETKMRRARKQHTCGECRDPIEPGEVYEHHRGLADGVWDENKTCSTCLAILRDLFSCGRIYGCMWTDIHETHCSDYVNGEWVVECICPPSVTG